MNDYRIDSFIGECESNKGVTREVISLIDTWAESSKSVIGFLPEEHKFLLTDVAETKIIKIFDRHLPGKTLLIVIGEPEQYTLHKC